MTTATRAPQLEPGTKAFIDAVVSAGGPKIYELTPDEARKVLSGAQAGAKLPEVDIEHKTLKGSEHGDVRIVIARPPGSKGKIPTFVFTHGAGWVLGGWDVHERLVRDLVVGAQAAAVFVDFDRAPEAKYPVANEQSYYATKYVKEHGDELNLDTSRLAIVGDSCGGNMATVVCIMAKQRGGPKIDFQLLFYPVTDHDFENGSYNQFADGPWLTKPAMKWFWNNYLPDEAARNQATVSPNRASLEELKGLPPALIMTDENDVLRDEGESYAHKLAAAGVEVTAMRFLGTIHDFVMLNAIADRPAARGAIQAGIDALRKVLH